MRSTDCRSSLYNVSLSPVFVCLFALLSVTVCPIACDFHVRCIDHATDSNCGGKMLGLLLAHAHEAKNGVNRSIPYVRICILLFPFLWNLLD